MESLVIEVRSDCGPRHIPRRQQVLTFDGPDAIDMRKLVEAQQYGVRYDELSSDAIVRLRDQSVALDTFAAPSRGTGLARTWVRLQADQRYAICAMEKPM